MSFILDALKKLDHKRQKGSVPDLMTVHDPAPQDPQGRSIWPYIFAAALLLNTIVMLALLNPWRSEEKITAQASQQSQPAPAAAPQPEVSPAGRPDEMPAADNTAPRDTPLEEKTHNTDPVPEEAAMQEKTVSEAGPTDEIIASIMADPPEIHDVLPSEDLPAEPVPSDIRESATEKGLPFLDELPVSVQQDIPDMSVTAHIYSNDPGSRMVSINGSILRQGDSVSPGLVVEEITPGGVILDHRGERFRVRGY